MKVGILYAAVLLLLGLPASDESPNATVGLLQSTVWKMGDYRKLGGFKNDEIEIKAPLAQSPDSMEEDEDEEDYVWIEESFMKFTDSEMIDVDHWNIDGDIEVDVSRYRYYLSDSVETEFDHEKVGRSKGGKYLIRESGSGSAFVYRVFVLPDNEILMRYITDDFIIGSSLSYWQPAGKKEREFVDKQVDVTV